MNKPRRQFLPLLTALALGCSTLLPAAPRQPGTQASPEGKDASLDAALDAGEAAADVPAMPQKSAERQEAESMLAHIAQSAAAYYRTPRSTQYSAMSLYCQFPLWAPATPLGTSCCDKALDADGDGRCDAQPNSWNEQTWSALQFTILDAHACRYQFGSSGNGKLAVFTATAFCDLDCDGQFSTFQLSGTGDPNAVLPDEWYLPADCTRVDFGPLVVVKEDPAAGSAQVPKLAPPSPAPAEAGPWLEQISAGARAYVAAQSANDACKFPGEVPTTAGGVSCCDAKLDADQDHRCDDQPLDWTAASWVALGMAGNGQRYCQYAFDSSEQNFNAKYTATAFCDTDCDGLFATFQLVGRSDATTKTGNCMASQAPSLFRDFENE